MLRLAAAVLFSLVPSLVTSLPAQSPAAAPAIVWHTDFAMARALAAATHAPLLVTFRCEA